LRGANLRGADLQGADLTGADLTGADLTGADLRDADLRGAFLTGVNLTAADLPDSLRGSRNIKIGLDKLRKWQACDEGLEWVESIGGEVSVTDCFAAEKDDYVIWLWGRVIMETLAALAEKEGVRRLDNLKESRAAEIAAHIPCPEERNWWGMPNTKGKDAST
jgi:hypothetical protein